MLDDFSNYLGYFLAFLFVLALIGIVAWLFKGLSGGRSNNGGGRIFGREKRIGVVQAASVDGRRKLILIRRDDKEHLIMVGGPVDMLIENGIEAPDALSARRSAHEPLTASADLDEAKAASADLRAATEPEFPQDDAQQDVPKKRISLTIRRDPSQGGDEP